MHDASDAELLRNYHRQGSEEAFAKLVERHVNLVYSAALRHAGIAAHAEEITQAVFIILARKADRLRPDTLLEAWLYETTRLTALSFLRGERRRQAREQEAYMQSTLPEPTDDSVWHQLAPLLDEAMARLGKNDREAVVLRYFKEKNLVEVAATLQISEAAAQSRVQRAVEKLRRRLTKRGVALSGMAITGAISAHSVQAAPVALAKSVTAVAVAKGAAASTSTLTLIKGALKIMAWTKMKTAVVVGVTVVLAVTSTTIVGIKLARPHRAAAKPLAALSPVMLNLTADMEANGGVHGVGTVVETNGTDQTILTDRIDNEEGSMIRITDESGQTMKYARQGRGYLVTLNKPVPPGGTISYTLEEELAAGILESDGVIKATAPDIREFRMASIPGNDFNMRCVEVWRLPAGAVLLGKPGGMEATTNAGQIELRFDGVIPPKGEVAFNFRYRLPPDVH
jgi:RNA polymerase sigma factor (sigma-70 family)